jgi:uncharacterized protein (TIGR02246 family)
LEIAMATDPHSESAVKHLVDSLVSAWNRHDAQAFARPFASDADFTNVFGMHATGREAIRQFHAPIFDTMFRESRLSATDTRVRFLRPDVAAIDVGWEMTGARDPDGRDWPLRKGLMSLIATGHGEEWSIAVMHNMDLPPEEMAQAQARVQAAAG